MIGLSMCYSVTTLIIIIITFILHPYIYPSFHLMMHVGVVTDNDRVAAIIKRVDSGNYTHVRGTWCSEIPYSGY